MGLLDAYKKTLKPLDVEEPIDVWLHRPVAYLLAVLLEPTRITPNQVTFSSILWGLAAFVCFVIPFSGHMQLAGVCIFMSAIFDCADGQLARMRKSSSVFGRMLDGVADGVVSIAITAGGSYCLLSGLVHSPYQFVFYAVLIVATAVTSPFHTSAYDHYKNLYLRLTHPTHREGEDVETAQARRQSEEEAGVRQSLLVRLAWPIYVSFMQGSERSGRWFDPYTARSLDQLPPYDEARGRVYRRHALPLLRVWRGCFGFGFLVFTFALAALLDRLEWFVWLRAVGLNILYFGLMMPWQRRASKRAFTEMGLVLPS